MNKALLGILKKKFTNKKGDWVEELPEVLWAYMTTVKTPTGEMPFTLVYKSEVVPPVEVGLPTHCTHHFDPIKNDRALKEHLDLLDEERDKAKIQTVLNRRRA